MVGYGKEGDNMVVFKSHKKRIIILWGTCQGLRVNIKLAFVLPFPPPGSFCGYIGTQQHNSRKSL